MVEPERGAAEHDERDRAQAGGEQPARRLAPRRQRDQERQRDRGVIGDPLLEAERARRKADDELEEQRAEDGRRADGGDGERRQGGGTAADERERCGMHAGLLPTA